ncbi:MAG: hypothetical protein JO352_25180 [Chloroflexi bacterium]|nr:hypothetical protein [Chloroflexota bacterium]MBV9595820.1 hypothetical protein [Chloroflexota bacterium]
MPAADLAEGLLVVLRWLHAAASIVFLGWSAVLWLDGPPRGDPAAARQRFKEITDLSLLVFLATGAVLSFDRLSHGAGGLYAGVLALKVVCAVVAYQFAFRWRRVGLPVGGLDGRIVLIFGAATVFLAAVLKGVFESGLSSSI